MKHRSAKILGTGILVAGLATPFAASANHTDDDWIFAVGTALTLAHYYDHDGYYPRHAYRHGYHGRHFRSQKHWRKHQRRVHRKAHRRANRYDYHGFAGRHDRRSNRFDGRGRRGNGYHH